MVHFSACLIGYGPWWASACTLAGSGTVSAPLLAATHVIVPSMAAITSTLMLAVTTLYCAQVTPCQIMFTHLIHAPVSEGDNSNWHYACFTHWRHLWPPPWCSIQCWHSIQIMSNTLFQAIFTLKGTTTSSGLMRCCHGLRPMVSPTL